MYRTEGISKNTALALIAFVLIVADIGLAEFVENPPVYIGQWTVSSPTGAAFDSSGNIYVVDRINRLVKKHDEHGVPITEWISCAAAHPSRCYAPYDIAVDSDGNVYVTDYMGITKFDQDGNFSTEFGFTGGTGPGITVYSSVESVESSGEPTTYIYLANSPKHLIQKFSPDGTFLKEWGGYGGLPGQFKFPYDVAVDSMGNVYVADWNNSRIQKFAPDGTFLNYWAINRPSGIDIDSSDNVYAISWQGCRIQKFTSEGVLLTQWGSCGSEEGKFKNPFRINVSPDREIYVSDTDNNRVQVFASNDRDDDSVSDAYDNCPDDSNFDQEDADEDGLGDVCDECPNDSANDIDKDSVCGDVDNCPEKPNFNQADSDGDGFGDACDLCDNRPITGSISPSRGVLWPPNHRMISVNIETSGLIVHNPTVQIGIDSVTIMESNKKGDNIYSENNFEPDVEFTGALSLDLRSERTGISQGRTYIITVTAVDKCSKASYNFSTKVIVPHDKGK
jgi:sugar lactone lactonase YvrE